jgi:hypothetical protein
VSPIRDSSTRSSSRVRAHAAGTCAARNVCCVSICTFVLASEERLLRQYLYICTRKASKLKIADQQLNSRMRAHAAGV